MSIDNQSPSPLEALLTSRDVCAYFGITSITLSRWIKAGKIPPGATMGGQLRWRRDEIELPAAESIREGIVNERLDMGAMVRG